jgi:Universal stress protein family
MGAESRATANNNTNNRKIQLKKILIPIDGSKCSLNAARCALKLAKDENTQVFCIHVIENVPYYGYVGSPHAIEQYYKDLEKLVQGSGVFNIVSIVIIVGTLAVLWYHYYNKRHKNYLLSIVKGEIQADHSNIIRRISEITIRKLLL